MHNRISNRLERFYFNCVSYLATPFALTRWLYRKLFCDVSEWSLRKHALICGSTGSGKSELLKFLFVQLACKRRRPPALIFVDPHGDACQELARSRALPKERIVYLDFSVSKNWIPKLNPFAIKLADNRQLDLHTDNLLDLFRLIIGADMTLHMSTLLRPGIELIIKRQGTLKDLQALYADELSPEMRHWLAQSGTDFLFHALRSPRYEMTRRALHTRLESLLGNRLFKHFILGTTTLEFEKWIRARKLIMIHLSKGLLGEETSSLIGRFIIAHLKTLAFKRAAYPEAGRLPVHVFIDEFEHYTTESIGQILSQARKYRLYLTLATQVLGQSVGTNLKRSVLANTNVKLFGFNDCPDTLTTMTKQSGLPLATFRRLGVGMFWHRDRNGVARKLRVPHWHLKNANARNDAQWQSLVHEQIKTHYKPMLAAQLTPELENRPRYPL